MLCGPTGCGKSTAAGLLVRALMRQGLERQYRMWLGIRWVEASMLVREVREHPLGNGRCAALDRVIRARLLILDDLGNHDNGDSCIWDVAQERSKAGLATVTTSGLKPEQLSRPPYGDALFRRLSERKGKPGIVVGW